MSVGVAAFADEADAAGRLANALDVPLTGVSVHRFPDDETMPVVAAPATKTTIVYRSLDRPNAKLVELLLAADAWRRAGARSLILVAPYFCYLRQDAVFAPGEPLSRDVIAPLIGRRFDALVTVQPHLHRTADLSAVLGTRAISLTPVEPLAAALPRLEAPLVIGPDSESAPWAKAWAERLGGRWLTLEKTRRGDRDVAVDFVRVDVATRPVVIVDDVASSGQTLLCAAKAARKAGAGSIDVAVAHALMDESATRRLYDAGVRRIVSTDSVRHPTNAARLAPMLAEAVRQVLAP